MKAKGWAVCDNGGILITTVSPERRAAIVNWLVMERKLMILSTDSDNYVEEAWHELKGDAYCCEVEISE